MGTNPWEDLKPGEIWHGFWDDAPARLPILAARGVHDGPTLLVTGGVHGDEYEGPAAIHTLFRTLDISALHGRVIGLPVVNTAAWDARTRCAPDDGQDLNRLFPGDALSKGSAALAAVVFETFVGHCDVLVDLHSGGGALIHMPLIGWYAGEDGEAERIARRFGGGLCPWEVPHAAGVLSYEAHRAGKVALGAEWGGGGCLDPAGVAAYAEGLTAILGHLAMLPAETEAVLDDRVPMRGDYQATPIDGLFLPSVALGDHVAVGQTLGAVYDLFGTPVAAISATWKGIVAGITHRALLRAEERVAYIG